MLYKVNKVVIETTKVNQRKNIAIAIHRFEKIRNQVKTSFIIFDIEILVMIQQERRLCKTHTKSII